MVGAPEDIHAGNIGRVWNSIDEMRREISDMKSDIAVIKTQVGELCKVEQRKQATRQGIFMAAIATVFGIIGAFASKLFGN